MKETGLLYLAGLILGILYSVADFFVFLNVDSNWFDFVPGFFFLILSEVFFPILICLSVIHLVTKGPAAYRLRSTGSILFGVYSVFLVYRIIVRGEAGSGMYLFVKPLLYGVLILIIDAWGWYIAKVYEKKGFSRKHIPLAAVILCHLIIPSLCEMLYLLKFSTPIWVCLFALYMAAGICAWLTKTAILSGFSLRNIVQTVFSGFVPGKTAGKKRKTESV